MIREMILECGRVNLSGACSSLSGSVVYPFEICEHEFKMRSVISDPISFTSTRNEQFVKYSGALGNCLLNK